MAAPAQFDLLSLTAEIVSAHVANNAVRADDLPRLIHDVHRALAGIGNGEGATATRPAVPVKKSVTPDYVICLEEGKKQKMLKRHLKDRLRVRLDPEQIPAERWHYCRPTTPWSPPTMLRLVRDWPRKSAWAPRGSRPAV